jgi:hypothetical protein
MDRTKFYNVVRGGFGPLEQSQVEGFNEILDYALSDRTRTDNLAYLLATVWHETAFTMQPVKEFGSKSYLKSKKYWPYIGRGYVQLTWNYNYQKASEKFNVDFVTYPDKVMEKRYALPILFTGMTEGWFTDKGFDDYLDGIDEGDKEDLREYSNARRIINGTDKQVHIGLIALKFEEALRQSGYALQPFTEVTEDPEVEPSYPSSPIKPKGFLELLIDFILKLFKRN